MVFEVAADQNVHSTCRCEAVDSFERVSLDDAAIGKYNTEHRSRGTIRRSSKKRCPYCTRIECARKKLGWQTWSQIPGKNAACNRIRRSSQRNPVWVKDRRRADSFDPVRRVRRPQAPKGVIYRQTARIAYAGELRGHCRWVVHAVAERRALGTEELHAT